MLVAPRTRRWLERVAGGTLVALGVRLAIEAR
jgi:threonine/homoserine/homoserine lactone efflux protein